MSYWSIAIEEKSVTNELIVREAVLKTIDELLDMGGIDTDLSWRIRTLTDFIDNYNSLIAEAEKAKAFK